MCIRDSHCTAVENGRPCGCGKRGCLEAHAAGPAITKNYMELGGTPGEDGVPPTAKEIAARARAGEEAAPVSYTHLDLIIWLTGRKVVRTYAVLATLDKKFPDGSPITVDDNAF